MLRSQLEQRLITARTGPLRPPHGGAAHPGASPSGARSAGASPWKPGPSADVAGAASEGRDQDEPWVYGTEGGDGGAWAGFGKGLPLTRSQLATVAQRAGKHVAVLREVLRGGRELREAEAGYQLPDMAHQEVQVRRGEGVAWVR